MVITKVNAKQIESGGYVIDKDIPLDGQPFSIYHNPITGQEFPRLPADSASLVSYRRKGLRIGPASEELRAKWRAGEAERQRKYEERVRRFETAFRINEGRASNVVDPSKAGKRFIEEEKSINIQPSLFDFKPDEKPAQKEVVQLKLL